MLTTMASPTTTLAQSPMSRTQLEPIPISFTQPRPASAGSSELRPMQSSGADLIRAIIHPSIIFSCLAWLCLILTLGLQIVKRTRRHQQPLLRDRLIFSITPAMMMLVIQLGLMLLQLHKPVCVSYNVKISGPQEERTVDPLWTLAEGCWFLSLAIGLSVAGIFETLIEFGRWREKIRELQQPPLCP